MLLNKPRPASIALLALLAVLPAIANAETLVTRNYTVTVEVNCEEGNVTCDDVTYRGVSNKTGKTIVLKGTTRHTICADGVTPCKFLGYQFKKGNMTYFVSDSGMLRVSSGKKVLVDEAGEWQ